MVNIKCGHCREEWQIENSPEDYDPYEGTGTMLECPNCESTDRQWIFHRFKIPARVRTIEEPTPTLEDYLHHHKRKK